MDSRKEQLLKLVVESYIETAEPVGSKFLVESGKINVSGATIRNEMRDLEEKGYLTHPHTSAGRIPTDAGYRYYVEKLLKPKKVHKKVEEAVSEFEKKINDSRQLTKEIAKFVAGHAGNAVIIAFGKNSVYYTGISYLFSQPEFRDYAHTVSVSTIFDQCEERLPSIFDQVGLSETKILIGSENPLGTNCSTIVSRFGTESLMALVGPMRMDYQNNLSLINYTISVIS